MHLLDSHKEPGPHKIEQAECQSPDILETTKQDHKNSNSQDLMVVHMHGEKKTETVLERSHVWANVSTAEPITIQQNRHTKKICPPIALIDELELWDDD